MSLKNLLMEGVMNNSTSAAMKRSKSFESDVDHPPIKVSRKSSHSPDLIVPVLKNGTKQTASKDEEHSSIRHNFSNTVEEIDLTNNHEIHHNVATTAKILKKAATLKPPSPKNQPFSGYNKISPESIDFGTCGICQKHYLNRNPLMLGCLHSFCSECLLQRKYFQIASGSNISQTHPRNDLAQQLSVDFMPDSAFQSFENLKKYLVENNKAMGKLVIKCKVCECNTRAKVVTKNLFGSKLIAEAEDADASSHREKKILCTNCEEKLSAIRFCKSCNEYLCEVCSNAHKRVKLTKEHVLDVLESHQSGQETGQNTFCLIHQNEELKLFCQTCCMLTCRDCQLSSHRHHKYQFVQEAAKEQIRILEAMKQRLNEKGYFLDLTSTSIEQHMHNILESQNKANEDIVQFHDKLQQQITNECQNFLSKVSQVSSFRQAKLTHQLNCNERLRAAVKHCIKFIDYASEEQNTLALLFAKQMIMEYVTTVMRQKFTNNPCVSSEISFTSDADILNRITTRLGVLRWGEAPPACSKTNVAPPRQLNKSQASFQRVTSQSRSIPNQMPNVNMSSVSRPCVSVRHFVPSDRFTVPAPRSISGSLSSPTAKTIVLTKPNQMNAKASSSHLSRFTFPVSTNQGAHIFNPQNRSTSQQHRTIRPTPMTLHSTTVTRLTSQPPSNPPVVHVSQTSAGGSSTRTGGPVSLISPVAEMFAPASTSQIPSQQLKPFVSKVVGNYQLSTVKLPAQQSINTKADVGSAKPVEARKQSLGSTAIQPQASFLAEVAEVTKQQVIPELTSNTKLPRDGDKVGTDESAHLEARFSSSDSGVASSTGKLNEDAAINKPATSPSPTLLAPPVLVDFSDIITMDDADATAVNENVKKSQESPASSAGASGCSDEDSLDDKVSKRLSLLAEEQQKKQIVIKKERSNSHEQTTFVESIIEKLPDVDALRPDVGSRTPDDNTELPDVESSEDQKYLYEENAEERTFDPNEDWCAVCNNGGDLLCCDTCPKVFHLHCHIPEIVSTPSGTWQCTFCQDLEKSMEADSKYLRRKRPTGLGLKELKLCEKLLLELYCHPQSTPFHLPVRASVPNYYKLIKEPIDLSKIKKRLQPSNFNHYEMEKEFLQDILLMLTNCFRFNASDSTIYTMGKKLQKYFVERVPKRLPGLSSFVDDLLQEQTKYLLDNPLEINAVDEEISEPVKKINEVKKSVPYEQDTAWEPGQEDEAEIQLVQFNPTPEELFVTN